MTDEIKRAKQAAEKRLIFDAGQLIYYLHGWRDALESQEPPAANEPPARSFGFRFTNFDLRYRPASRPQCYAVLDYQRKRMERASGAELQYLRACYAAMGGVSGAGGRSWHPPGRR
jgi:hypothetical protein